MAILFNTVVFSIKDGGFLTKGLIKTTMYLDAGSVRVPLPDIYRTTWRVIHIEDIEHIKPLVRSGDRIQKLKQRESFCVHRLDALKYPAIYEDVDFTCFPEYCFLYKFLCTSGLYVLCIHYTFSCHVSFFVIFLFIYFLLF